MLRVLRLNFEAASGVGLSDSESESTCLTLSESPRRSSWGTPKAASGIHWLSGRADSDADSGSEDPPGPISASLQPEVASRRFRSHPWPLPLRVRLRGTPVSECARVCRGQWLTA